MNKKSIYTVIGNTCGVDLENIKSDSDLYDDFNCDHNDIVELKLQLEDMVKDQISSHDFFECQTVSDLLTLIEGYSDELID
jgi:acyl carrier protein